MSETTTAPTEKKTPISRESAEEQIAVLYDAFDVPETDGPREKLIAAAMRGRLEISGSGDDIKIMQRLKRAVAGQSALVWNWSRLGMGKSRMAFQQIGGAIVKLSMFDQAYKLASPMVGLEEKDIHGMHPADLTVLEDVSAFFQAI